MHREEAEMKRGLMRRTNLWIAVLLLALAVLPLTACQGAEEDAAASGSEPVKVEAVEGSDELHLVTLTAHAAKRIDVQTAEVRSKDGQTIVPYSAIVYETDGGTWVYTNPDGLSFVRAKIAVRAINGDTAVLAKGPAAGTKVATVGVAELFGAENGIGADSGH
jgi:hypothetical protein